MDSYPNSPEDDLVSFTTRPPDMEVPEDVKVLTNYKVVVVLEYYVLPVISLFGLIGNVLSLMVVTQKHKRRLKFYIYLAGLAVADSNTLIQVTIFWVSLISGAPKEWLCQLTGYLAQVSSGIAAWIVVAVTIDRYLAISNPLR